MTVESDRVFYNAADNEYQCNECGEVLLGRDSECEDCTAKHRKEDEDGPSDRNDDAWSGGFCKTH